MSWPLNFRVRVFLKSAVKAATFLSKSTGNEPFPQRISLHAIKFVLPSVLTLKRRLAQEFVQNQGRRVQKVHFQLACVGQKRRSSMSNDEIKVWATAWATALVRCTHALKSHACIFLCFFSAKFTGPRFVEIQIMLPRQREVTLFLSITYHKNLTSVYIFLFCRTSHKKIGFSSLILTYPLDSDDKKNIFLPSLSPFFF